MALSSIWSLAFSVLPFLAAASPLFTVAGVRPSATIEAGVIVGTATSIPSSTVTVNKFLGIPFAAPPLRFAPPVKPQPWSKPLNTSTYGPACIQQFNYPAAARNFTIEAFDTPGPPAGESEDCLSINVYAPASPGRGRTVMFWIYGGSLQFGSNSDIYYDGTSFAAQQDVIIVAPNYRTNVFGFPMAPELPLAERNLGFLDQRLALEWVQTNIAAFGGDPGKVTIFGESAGAASVDELITTMPKNPPFRAGIMESGQTNVYVNHNNSNSVPWNSLMKLLNCTTSNPAKLLECARAADALTIKSLEEHHELSFVPVSDNITQLEFPEAARLAGKIARVPILTGTNAQEYRIFLYGQNVTTALLDDYFPGLKTLQTALLDAYPVGSAEFPSTFDAISAILTDFVYHCPSALTANHSTKAGIPAWRYLFNATFPNTQFVPNLGVFHSSEIPIVYGTYPRVNATAEEQELSNYMQKAWANFAKNPDAGPGWPGNYRVGVLGSPGEGLMQSTSAGSLDGRCALYSEVYAALGI